MGVKASWDGRYFEDFGVGDVYRSRIGRTISDADNTHFTLLTNNTNQIHFNENYASRTEFGRTLVNSALTLAIVAGLAVADTSENGFALGWDQIMLPNPLFAGDTLYADSEVLETRASGSRPGWGVIKVRQRGIKQDGTVVLVMTRSFMVPSRAAAPARAHFPEPKAK
ncbi:MAG: MaoC family dehydratase [Chloroflexota bacterium]|nr:MaoC family dehydratase [Chloroflexota bacterium]